MILRTVITVACIFSACARPPTYVRECDRITKGFCEEALPKHELVVLGQGGAFKERQIDSFFVDFERQRPTSREEARQILVDCVETLIARINSDEKIAKNMTHHPISVRDVSISIGFVDEKREPHREFSQIHLYNNNIYYSLYDPEAKSYVAFDHQGYQTARRSAEMASTVEESE